MFGSNMQPRVVKKQARGPWKCPAVLDDSCDADGVVVQVFLCEEKNPGYRMQCGNCGYRPGA
jgi:ribosomal protein S27AE